MSAAHNPSPSALTRSTPALILATLVATSSVRSQEPPPPAPGASETVAGAQAGAWSDEEPPLGWIVHETRAYQLQSRLGKVPTEALAERLDALLELYRDLLPSPARSERLVVKVLADEGEYKLYAGAGTAGASHRFGRFDAGSGEVVAWNTRLLLGQSELTAAIRLDPDRVTTLTYGENQGVIQLADAATRAYTPDVGEVLARACFRQYLELRVWPEGGPALPAWLEQGLAEHFATATPDSRGRLRPGLSAPRVRELGWLLLEGDTRPLVELLRPEAGASPFEVGPGPPTQGWALIHFLMTSDDPARRQLVPRLLAQLGKTGDYERAAEAVLAEVDFERLQSDWQVWAAALPIEDPLLDLARRYGDKVRPDQLTGDLDLKRRYGWLWNRRNGPQPPGSLPRVPPPDAAK